MRPRAAKRSNSWKLWRLGNARASIAGDEEVLGEEVAPEITEASETSEASEELETSEETSETDVLDKSGPYVETLEVSETEDNEEV